MPEITPPPSTQPAGQTGGSVDAAHEADGGARTTDSVAGEAEAPLGHPEGDATTRHPDHQWAKYRPGDTGRGLTLTAPGQGGVGAPLGAPLGTVPEPADALRGLLPASVDISAEIPGAALHPVKGFTYTVQPGENTRAILERFAVLGIDRSALERANLDLDALEPGTELALPVVLVGAGLNLPVLKPGVDIDAAVSELNQLFGFAPPLSKEEVERFNAELPREVREQGTVIPRTLSYSGSPAEWARTAAEHVDDPALRMHLNTLADRMSQAEADPAARARLSPPMPVPRVDTVRLDRAQADKLFAQIVPTSYQEEHPRWRDEVWAAATDDASPLELADRVFATTLPPDAAPPPGSGEPQRSMFAELLGSMSIEGGGLAGTRAGSAAFGGEVGLRFDMRKFMDAFSEPEGNRNALTFIAHTAILQGFIGSVLWAGDRLGVDQTWDAFINHNGGPKWDMAGGRFSWKDGNFGDWIGNGIGHPTVFFAASQYYRKMGYGDLAAWFGGMATNAIWEFFWEHFEKTPGVSGHDFWVANLIGVTIGALSEQTLGEGRSVGLAVHAGAGGRYRLYHTIMEAYFEDSNSGVRHSFMWSPNYLRDKTKPVPRSERPFMPYDLGYRYTDLERGFYVGGFLEMNNEAKTGKDFKLEPVRGFRIEAGVTFDFGKVIKLIGG